MGVSILDYLVLAKAGYKKADIDSIIALSEKEEGNTPEEQQAATAAPIEPTTESAESLSSSEKAEAPEPEKEVIDYKSLYEKSQADLKAAQAENRSRDSSQDQPDMFKSLQDSIRSFL